MPAIEVNPREVGWEIPRINYDFAAKFNDFAAKISPLIFNVFAVNF